MGEVLRGILKKLRSNDLDMIQSGIGEADRLLKVGIRPEEQLLLMEAVVGLFYLDLFDRPDLAPVVDSSVNILSSLGENAILYLVDQMSQSDMKASMAMARTLGKIGKEAIPFLEDLYDRRPDPFTRSMVLYAFSNIMDPEVLTVFERLIQALNEEHHEIRDTSARTIGKLFEHFKTEDFKENQVTDAFDALMSLLADEDAPVRSKSVRSLGKLAKGGFLDRKQVDHLEMICRRILGEMDFEWDHAYIVRAEAEEILRFMGDNPVYS